MDKISSNEWQNWEMNENCKKKQERKMDLSMKNLLTSSWAKVIFIDFWKKTWRQVSFKLGRLSYT